MARMRKERYVNSRRRRLSKDRRKKQKPYGKEKRVEPYWYQIEEAASLLGITLEELQRRMA